MNRIGFLADLSVNNDNSIEQNKSIEKLLKIIEEKCEDSSSEFETISKSDDETTRNIIINFNQCQRDIKAIKDCVENYCKLNNINLFEYIMNYHSDSNYLSNIFLGCTKDKKNNISR